MLKEVATRLTSSVRKEEFVSRIGGDEFVLITFTSNRNEAELVANHILSSLDSPIKIGQNGITVRCSIGGAFYPTDDTDIDSVIKYADEALYVSKEKGKNQVSFYKK